VLALRAKKGGRMAGRRKPPGPAMTEDEVLKEIVEMALVRGVSVDAAP
jgi:hypothetical protein